MKVAISTAVLLVLLGTTASSYARQEKGQEHSQAAKPAEQQHAQQQAKPAEQQQHAQQQARPAQQQHAQQQAKPAQQQHAQQQARPAQQQHAQQVNAGQSHAQQTHAESGNGGRYGHISDAHYAASFGSGHRFHVSQSDYQHRRFQYGGYSFGFVDPWPVDWGYSDYVYVVYVDGGYYMYDAVHPGVRIAVSIF